MQIRPVAIILEASRRNNTGDQFSGAAHRILMAAADYLLDPTTYAVFGSRKTVETLAVSR